MTDSNNNNNYSTYGGFTAAPTGADLAKLQDQLNAQAANRQQAAAPRSPVAAPTRREGTVEVTYSGGVAHVREYGGTSTTYAKALTPAGMIDLPGIGLTTIAAAKSAGFIPEHWQAGQPVPGGQQQQQQPHAPKAAPQGATDGATEGATDGDTSSPEYVARKAAVEEASRVLTQADSILGEAAVSSLVNAAVLDGLPTADRLPPGVTEAAVQQVYAGYVAQADNALAQVGSSVAGLEGFLTESELLRARQATINGNHDALKDLGRLSLDRLAQLPQRDPESFKATVEALPAAERKAIRYHAPTQTWLITHPTYGEVNFGTAIKLGIVKFN